MKVNKTHKLTISAIFTAIIFVATYFVKVPTPMVGGYVNLGDAFVILSGMILGPIAFIPAALGSSLADLLSGYAIYIPATFIIKGVSALLIGLIFKREKGIFSKIILKCIICGLISGVLIVVGYLLYELCIYGAAAFINVPFNAIQGAFGIIVSTVLLPFALKIFKKLK